MTQALGRSLPSKSFLFRSPWKRLGLLDTLSCNPDFEITKNIINK